MKMSKELFFLIATLCVIGILVYALTSEYQACNEAGGKLVRGVFWWFCIK